MRCSHSAQTTSRQIHSFVLGEDGGKCVAEECELNFLGQIPLVQSIREGGDYGTPVMAGDEAITKKAFQDFASAAVRSIAMRNAEMPATKTLEILA